jgi:hypothetical protein
MMLRRIKHRCGLTRADVLVAVLLSLTALGLLGCGLASSREAAKRIECVNNLKQLGIAFHNFHDKNLTFPTESGSNPSFYQAILPFLGGDPEVQQAMGGDKTAAIKLFLCPSRRTSQMAPGKRDYGYAASAPAGVQAVLDSKTALTLTAITNANGSSNTLLLSHLWMDPKNYSSGDATDQGWATKNNSRSVNNTAKQDSDSSGTTTHIGGPHPHLVPCLFVDGHMQNIPFTWQNWSQAWNYTNSTPFTLP